MEFSIIDIKEIKEQTSMTVLDSAALNWEALVQEAKRHLQLPIYENN